MLCPILWETGGQILLLNCFLKNIDIVLCNFLAIPVPICILYLFFHTSSFSKPDFYYPCSVPIATCYSGSFVNLRSNFLFPLLSGGCLISLSASGSIPRRHSLTTELSAARHSQCWNLSLESQQSMLLILKLAAFSLGKEMLKQFF